MSLPLRKERTLSDVLLEILAHENDHDRAERQWQAIYNVHTADPRLARYESIMFDAETRVADRKDEAKAMIEEMTGQPWSRLEEVLL